MQRKKSTKRVRPALVVSINAAVRAAVVARAKRTGRPTSHVVEELLRAALDLSHDAREAAA